MGFFDIFRSTRKNESLVRIAKNTDDIDGLSYNPNNFLDDAEEVDNLLTITEINKFRYLQTERNEKYNSFDLMAQDSRIASVLNMYTDDCTQYNQSGKVIWAESPDPNCADFVNRLIDNLQLNKLAWSHIYSLNKYGNLYIELFYDNELDSNKPNNASKDDLIYQPILGAKLTEHIEAVKNPAGMFNLVKHGKTNFFIKCAGTNNQYDTVSQNLMSNNYTWTEDDMVMPPDKYVHITINDNYSRFPNKYILQDTKTESEVIYDIKEGSSILENVFKTWSELNLLEDSLLMNRLSKSAIIRLIQIEVGNTDDTDVQEILRALRDKISRSRYFDKSTGEYKNQVNPGPLENIIYHATHKGNGAISHDTIGGDVNVKDIADIDYYLEKLAQGVTLPLAYLKQTNDDGGGLSAGTSLTKFDARYGRTLKRIQNSYISGITDLINIFAYKRNVPDYINNYTIKMVSPSAVEDNERDEKLTSHTEMIRSIMDVINGQEDAYNVETKKEILNYLIKTLLQDNGLSDILEEDMIKNPVNDSISDDIENDNIEDTNMI